MTFKSFRTQAQSRWSFRRPLAGAVMAILFLVPSMARAASHDVAQANAGDTAWMLVATALVLLMTIPGLLLFYGGMVRKKNALTMMIQGLSVTCVATIVWMVIGYSLAFTEGNNIIGGLGQVLLRDLTPESLTGTIPESVFISFQMTFAIVTPVLMVGAFVSRMKFSALLIFVTAWLIVVYAPIAHWVWGGGFLADWGVLDFAGGTVVHINAGVAGLVAVLVIGPRIGHGKEYHAPHSLVLSFVGAGLLWVGWFGFNAGSALAANGAAGMALLVTQLAAATAALTWAFIEWYVKGKPSGLGLISGAVGGLVAITPASGYVGPMGALAIGVVAGGACYWGAVTLKGWFGYDDSLDAFGVHGIGGIVGALLTGVFAQEVIGGTSGLIEGNVEQLGLQAVGVAITIAYCGVVTFVLLKLIGWTVGLRVAEDVEVQGLDIRVHGERAYEL